MNASAEWRAERPGPGRKPILFNTDELYRWFGVKTKLARNILDLEVGQRYADPHGWIWERIA